MLLSPLEGIDDFLFWGQRYASVPGYLRDLEAHALLLLASGGPGVGEIVEVGSYLGRSTVFLAGGSQKAGREKVTAIDHFQGSPEHQAGQLFESQVLTREGTTYHQFLANLKRMGVIDHVNPIVAASQEAVRAWDRPIRLLFIDGDHSYASSRQDFELWSRFVVPAGIICFHDINQWPGVTRFYQELMKNPGPFQEVATVCTLKVIQRSLGTSGL